MSGAISQDHNLEHLMLHMEDGFTDKAGVAFEAALTVNKALRKITLAVYSPSNEVYTGATFDVSAQQAFNAMLRVSTTLALKLPPLEFTGAADQSLLILGTKCLLSND